MGAFGFDLTVRRGGFHLSAQLEVAAGEVVALLGASGSGKSTLLAAVAGLVPAQGRVHADGGEVGSLPPWRRRLALVPQKPSPLFPRLPVHAAVARVAAGSGDLSLAALLSLEEVWQRPSGQLSGGQLARLALAQALAAAPRGLLLDEPLSSQDAYLRPLLAQTLSRWARATGTGTLWTTHDPEEAGRVADRVAVLAGGRVAAQGPMEVVLRSPPSWEVARLLGYRSWVPAGGGWAYALHPRAATLGAEGPIAVRVQAVVVARRPVMGGVLLWAKSEAAGMVEAHLPPEENLPSPGQEVTLSFGWAPRIPMPVPATPMVLPGGEHPARASSLSP
jgi:thiamine transport system ATP-binding protein